MRLNYQSLYSKTKQLLTPSGIVGVSNKDLDLRSNTQWDRPPAG